MGGMGVDGPLIGLSKSKVTGLVEVFIKERSENSEPQLGGGKIAFSLSDLPKSKLFYGNS